MSDWINIIPPEDHDLFKPIQARLERDILDGCAVYLEALVAQILEDDLTLDDQEDR